MEIDPTRSTASALGGQTVEPESSDLDRDAFMRLLVTQIRNQDPMDPMDTSQMMSQLTELTSVEHLLGIREGLQTLEVASASIANAQVADFVGKTVTADTSTLRVGDTGELQGAFELDGRAENVTVTIRDAAGEVVRTLELGDTFPGAQGFTWDGNNNLGERVDVGRYRVEIEAVNSDGAVVPVDTQVRGRVTSVSYADGYPELVLDGEHRVAMGDVRDVADATGSTAGAAPNPSLALASYEASRVIPAPTTGASEE